LHETCSNIYMVMFIYLFNSLEKCTENNSHQTLNNRFKTSIIYKPNFNKLPKCDNCFIFFFFLLGNINKLIEKRNIDSEKL